MSKIIQQYRIVNQLTSIQKWRTFTAPDYLPCISCTNLVLQHRRYQKPPPRQGGLISKFMENLREGMSKNKQLQENLKKFQDEKSKMDEKDSLKGVKDRLSRMNQVKEAASPYIEKVEETVKVSSKHVEKLVKDAADSEVFKKSQEVTEGLAKSVKEAATKISEQGEEMGKTQVGKAVKTVKADLFDDIAKESRPYQRPEKLRRRTGRTTQKVREYEADESAQDVVLHKDSKWQQQWKDFRDNNTVVTGFFNLKSKYDESDNVAIRATRVVTEKLSGVFSDVFSTSEMAATIAEITKIDPSFNKDSFVKECEFEIIPTVLEAFLRGDVEVLQDWCHEGAFNVLSTMIKQHESLGIVNHSKILDIRDVDLLMAKIMEQGPVLIFTFQAQQVEVLKDKYGKIVEGSEDTILNVTYVWAMCRDQSILDHRSAWRVLEFAQQSSASYM